ADRLEEIAAVPDDGEIAQQRMVPLQQVVRRDRGERRGRDSECLRPVHVSTVGRIRRVRAATARRVPPTVTTSSAGDTMVYASTNRTMLVSAVRSDFL